MIQYDIQHELGEICGSGGNVFDLDKQEGGFFDDSSFCLETIQETPNITSIGFCNYKCMPFFRVELKGVLIQKQSF